jgi:radical SAM superfamily enzyme YgiQ (UPF0313 family)
MAPLGILYLASWLRKFGHDPHIIDLAGVPDWRKHLLSESSKIVDSAFVGITCTTPQYFDAIKIHKFLESQNIRIPVVVGGIHLTSVAHVNEMDFLKDGFDSYVIGEGFNAVTKMCDDIEECGRLKKIYTEPIIRDVNDLPYAARDLIDIRSYDYHLGDVKTCTQYTQWGCPYSCQYCESPLSGSWTVRAMHPQRIQDEVRQVRDDFGIYGHMFFDDEMNLDKKRMLGICAKLRELGDITWRGFVVTAKFDAELAGACKSSGCYEIASGIESGSEEILRKIRKPATRAINRRFVITAKNAGLRVKLFLIVGLPGESWKTIQATDEFLSELSSIHAAPDDIDVSILQVYKGAPIYQNAGDVVFKKDWSEKSYYKAGPGTYEDAGLVQVTTAQMSEYDLIAARNYLESRYKQKDWIKNYTDRKDYDDIYGRADIAESIAYAEKKLAYV